MDYCRILSPHDLMEQDMKAATATGTKIRPFWVFHVRDDKSRQKVWHQIVNASSTFNITRCGKDFQVDSNGSAIRLGWTVPKSVRRSVPTALKANEHICRICGRA